MVTNPISAPPCSATTMLAFGTSSLFQRSRHQVTRAEKSIRDRPAPGVTPQCNRRVFVGGRVGTQGERKRSSCVPRTQRSAPRFATGALQSRGPFCASTSNRGPGSAERHEERCTASGTREWDITVPSASARCGGCACRLLRSRRYRAAGIRQNRPRPGAAPARRAKSDIAPPRSRARTTIPSST